MSAVGLFGAALFFGDGFVAPAISVPSAMEGLDGRDAENSSASCCPAPWLILTALFLIQRHSTGAIGRLFGAIYADLVPDARGASAPAAHRAIARCDALRSIHCTP